MLGADLLKFLAGARREVLIAAPFIRLSPFQRLIDAVHPDICVRVVTRWRPTEVIAGVSDIDVLLATRSRNIPLLLQNDLHAKLYLADDACLVGSANITDTALGWRQPANLELLVRTERRDPAVTAFLERLFDHAVEATDAHRDRLQDLVLSADKDPQFLSALLGDSDDSVLLPTSWVPAIKNPEEMYLLYSGAENLVLRTAIAAMRAELGRFSVPVGLNESDFRSWVACILSHSRIVELTTKRIQQGEDINENMFREMLVQIGADPDKYALQEVMTALQRWLEYFLPGHYGITTESVKLGQAKRI
ncbi:MAG: phospholipase D-like domain-containing protein [Spirochaetaceae bacterium]|nr:phospholipase D-like domain-containing protein [Spirochaetaceae bacterium]